MENKIEIYTLGEFKVKYNDEIISPKEKVNSKPWLFFKYLITEKEKNLHPEVISSDLWPKKKIKNPKHSITNLVYRLRKKFKLSNIKDSNKYIINSNGSCFFNTESNYWLDIEEFLELSQKASRIKRNKPTQAIPLFKESLNLYNGDYLPEIPYQEWVIPHRNNYHWLFVETVIEYIKLLKKYDRYREITTIAEKALNIESYEEELHINYLDALLKLGENAHARSHYTYANELFNDNLDISNLPKLQSFFETNNNSNNFITDIQKELKDRNNIKGAFTCKNDIFRMIYELEERRTERTDKPVFLSYLKFEKEEILKKNDYIIENIIESELRKGDVITRWDYDKYLMLLMDMSRTDVSKVIKRLKKEIKEEIKIKNEDIKYGFDYI